MFIDVFGRVKVDDTRKRMKMSVFSHVWIWPTLALTASTFSCKIFCLIFVFVFLIFSRMPVLYSELGVPGRILSSLFFLCLSLAGVTSLVALLELPIHTLEEMKSGFFSAINCWFCNSIFVVGPLQFTRRDYDNVV